MSLTIDKKYEFHMCANHVEKSKQNFLFSSLVLNTLFIKTLPYVFEYISEIHAKPHGFHQFGEEHVKAHTIGYKITMLLKLLLNKTWPELL